MRDHDHIHPVSITGDYFRTLELHNNRNTSTTRTSARGGAVVNFASVRHVHGAVELCFVAFVLIFTTGTGPAQVTGYGLRVPAVNLISTLLHYGPCGYIYIISKLA